MTEQKTIREVLERLWNQGFQSSAVCGSPDEDDMKEEREEEVSHALTEIDKLLPKERKGNYVDKKNQQKALANDE